MPTKAKVVAKGSREAEAVERRKRAGLVNPSTKVVEMDPFQVATCYIEQNIDARIGGINKITLVGSTSKTASKAAYAKAVAAAKRHKGMTVVVEAHLNDDGSVVAWEVKANGFRYAAWSKEAEEEFRTNVGPLVFDIAKPRKRVSKRAKPGKSTLVPKKKIRPQRKVSEDGRATKRLMPRGKVPA
jgi:hypothetical protein